jgi:hypothetical protein
METVLEFKTAVVLYEAGASYQQQFFQLDFGLFRRAQKSAPLESIDTANSSDSMPSSR